MEWIRHWVQAAHVSMTGGARAKALIGLGYLGLAGAGVLAFFLLAGGDSNDESPLTQGPPEATESEAPAQAGAPLGSTYRMIIERIGVDAPVVTYGLDENRVPIVPTGPDAAQVVAWYDFSATPGTGSNAVFAGHVTWNGDAVFHELHTLQAGDIIRLRDDTGGEILYRVTSNAAMDPNDPEAVQTMYPTETDMVTIITCGGEFFENSDPVAGGDYTQRIIIRGELVG